MYFFVCFFCLGGCRGKRARVGKSGAVVYVDGDEVGDIIPFLGAWGVAGTQLLYMDSSSKGEIGGEGDEVRGRI